LKAWHIYLNTTYLDFQKLPLKILSFQKKVKINLQFKMVSYICTRNQEEKFELIATSYSSSNCWNNKNAKAEKLSFSLFPAIISSA